MKTKQKPCKCERMHWEEIAIAIIVPTALVFAAIGWYGLIFPPRLECQKQEKHDCSIGSVIAVSRYPGPVGIGGAHINGYFTNRIGYEVKCYEKEMEQ